VRDDAWERLYTLLQEEILRAKTVALNTGVSPDQLAEQLDERIVRLRLEITTVDRP
jgi:hypothetical protein